jgi:hypothetical protein
MMAAGTFVQGVHYFRPRGPRSRAIFKWTAIERFIEGEPEVHHDFGDLRAAARSLLS